jgi:hypothetical protein
MVSNRLTYDCVVDGALIRQKVNNMIFFLGIMSLLLTVAVWPVRDCEATFLSTEKKDLCG